MGKSKSLKAPLTIVCLVNQEKLKKSLRKVFEVSGYRLYAEFIPTRQKFTQFLRKSEPDFILADTELKDLPGTEAFKIAKKIRPEIPFICLTNAENEKIANKLLQMGAADLVFKDRLNRFSSAIEKILETASEMESRRKIEAALQLSEIRFRYLFENMLEGYAYCKVILRKGKVTDFTYIEVNDAFEKLTELKNAAGRKVSEVIPGIRKTNPELFEIYGRVAMTGIPEKFETWVKALGIWLSISVYSPQREYFIAVFDNITARKNSEKALQENEEKFRRLVEIMPDGIAVHSDGNIVFVNPAAVTILGAESPGDLLGKPAIGFVHPDDREKVIKRISGVLSKGMTSDVTEERFLRLDGSVIFVQVVAVSTTYQNRPSVQVIFRDITERKKADETIAGERNLLLTLINNLPDYIYVKNTEGKYILGNAAIIRLLDLSSLDDLVGKTAFDFFPAELAKKYRDDENRILETGRGIYDHESPMIDSGVEKWVSTVKVPLRDGMGKITGFVGLDKDITSRRQAEQEFRLKSAALQAAANGIIITDASGSIIWANQAFVRQTGYSEEEVVDRNPRELLKSGKHDREFYGKMWENILAGQVWQGELINRRKDGSLYYEEMTITPIVDQGGKITHFIAIKQDITRRKQAEESFKLASQELENLHNNLQEAIFSFDPVNNKMLVVSIAHEKIFGYPREDFINNPRFWYELILPEDRPIVDAGYPALNAGNSIQHEVRIRRGDGQIRWIEAHAHPRYDENENLIRIDGFTTDVTDRKLIENALLENELNLNRAQALAHIGSWMVNMADNKLTWSPETYRIFGLPSGKELTFNDYLSFVHPDDRDFVSQTSLDSLKGEPYDIEYRILSGKKVKWVRVVAEVEADELGTIFKRIGTVQDITERKFAEEKIRLLNIDLEHRIYQRTSELEEANKELESFAYSVSHDLRTPLRSIAGFGAILRNEHSGSLDEDGKNLLDTVIKNTVKMGQLIDNLLEFSRMARKEMKIGKVNMDRIATEVLKEMISLEQNRKIEYEIDSLIPCLGDNAMLHHVWSNLISNALKYSRKKELTKVEIGSRLENGTILYFIRDNGSGFDMRYYHKLFGVFQRLHSINEFEGTGVGLAFVKRIVNRHGGKVWAEGKSGEGAVFYFSIPDEAPMNTESGKG